MLKEFIYRYRIDFLARTSFKKNVKCAICGVQPEEGQKIDNWFLTKIGEQISLVCTDCKKEEPDEDSPEMPVV